MKPSISDKLKICSETRKIASESLVKVLKAALLSKSKISEVDFQNQWLNQLQKYSEIFPSGWYVPPPDGIGVLFATDDNPERIDFTTLRKKEYWPHKDVYLNRDRGLIMVYVSPVNRNNFIIGDFGVTIYLGKNKEIQDHLKKCLKAVYEICEKAEIGMKFSEISRFANKLFNNKQLINHGWLSITGPTSTNLGHTIPFIYSNNQISKSSWPKTLQAISDSRVFVDEFDNNKIQPPLGFTIEPRLKAKDNDNLPSVYFHTIVQFKKNGRKELLTNFEEIFKVSKMDYML